MPQFKTVEHGVLTQSKILKIASAIVVSVLFFIGVAFFDKERETEYYSNTMRTAIARMVLSQTACELIHSSTAKLWSNAIEDRYGRGFDSVLQGYYDLDETKAVLKTINETDSFLINSAINLQNTPEKFKNVYQSFIDMYTVYTQSLNLAKSPSGSLLTYNSARNDLSAKFHADHAKVIILMPKT